MKPSSQEDSPMDMSQTIEEISRLRFLGIAAMGVAAALKDDYHRPRAPVITEEAKAWVVHVACCKPKEFGYAAEMWT